MTILATECAHAGQAGASIPVLDLSTAQQISVVTGSSTACTNAVGATTTIVTVWSTENFYVASGETPVAATNGGAWMANVPLDIKTTPGVSKIAARGITAASTLYIMERS